MASLPSQSETEQERCGEVFRRCRDLEGFSQVTRATSVKSFPFFRDSPQFELVLVEWTFPPATLDSAKILIERQGQEKAVDIGVRIDIKEPATQVVEFLRCTPNMVDDEVAIPPTPMVRDEQGDGRMQVSDLVGGRWVGCDEMVAIQHHAPVDAFGRRFGER